MLVQQLVAELREQSEVILHVVNTNQIRGSGWRAPWIFFRDMGRMFRLTRTVDVVSIHISGTRGTSPAFLLVGTCAVLSCALWNRPLIIRTFANRYESEAQGGIARWWTRRIIRAASLFLVETQSSVRQAREEGLSTPEWFPNSRPLPAPSTLRSRSRCKRWVYVGQIRPMKGMEILKQAAERLSEDVQIDLIGGFWDGMSERDFEESRLNYRGVIEPEEMIAALQQYDALVLPTLYDSEGYPGVILEAYAAGIPVVASRVGGIPEIVSSEAGILVEKGNVEELAAAMRGWSNDESGYQRACAAVLEARQQFSSERWSTEFVRWARELRDAH